MRLSIGGFIFDKNYADTDTPNVEVRCAEEKSYIENLVDI